MPNHESCFSAECLFAAEATLAVAGVLSILALLLSEHFIFDLDQKQ